MDIESLKKSKRLTEQLHQDGIVPLTYCDNVIELIDEAIARQSKSEDVAEAIINLEIIATNMMGEILNGNPLAERKVKAIDLAITALQAYEPTISKTETVEKVAIPKTETTSAKKITVDIQLRPLLDDLEVDIDDIKEYINKLKEDEDDISV